MIANDPDPEYLMIDGSIVQGYQHGAKKNEQANEAEGKSGGGLSTKIPVAVDAPGNPVLFIVRQSQSSEYDQAASIIEGFKANFVLADKGYDANRLDRANQG